MDVVLIFLKSELMCNKFFFSETGLMNQLMWSVLFAAYQVFP